MLISSALVFPVAREVPIRNWHPARGDRIVVDTKENEAYLIHKDGRFINFDVITGQRRSVYYIGRSYNGATPERKWVVKSQDFKGDRYTFGPSGSFLRLHWDGEETPYGFHGHKAEKIMFERESRYQSMGCIIVTDIMLHVLEKTFELNEENGVQVITRYGVENPVGLAYAS